MKKPFMETLEAFEGRRSEDEERQRDAAFFLFQAAMEEEKETGAIPEEIARHLTAENACEAVKFSPPFMELLDSWADEQDNPCPSGPGQFAWIVKHAGSIPPQEALGIANQLIATAAFIGRYLPKTEEWLDGWLDGLIQEAIELREAALDLMK